jgi:hypothetical protein
MPEKGMGTSFIQIIIVIFSALNKHFINNAQNEKQNIKDHFFIFINKRKHYFGFCMGPMGTPVFSVATP